MPFVTFIIPTKGRETLLRTLQSLDRQTDSDWSAIIVGDGLNPTRISRELIEYAGDSKFFFMHGPSLRSAGLTRNLAMDIVMFQEAAGSAPKYVAFVDDDDWLTDDYVALLRDAHGQELPGVIVFRMDHPTLGTVPPGGNDEIRHGNVGISYAIKWEPWGREFRFIREQLQSEGPNGNEDIQLLLRLKQSGARIFVSPHVTYNVGNPRTIRS